MRAGARAPGQAGAEAGLSGRVRLPAWCKASDSRIPPVASGVLCCRGPTGSQTPACSAADCANGSIMLTAWEGLEHPAVTPFPCSILGFDLPLAIVSKDQGTSVTFKGPIEPPGDETSSRGSTTTAEGSRAGSVSSSRGERCGDQCV